MQFADITVRGNLRAKLAKLHERHDLCQLIQSSKPSGEEDVCGALLLCSPHPSIYEGHLHSAGLSRKPLQARPGESSLAVKLGILRGRHKERVETNPCDAPFFCVFTSRTFHRMDVWQRLASGAYFP